jgi:hypothetical protein
LGWGWVWGWGWGGALCECVRGVGGWGGGRGRGRVPASFLPLGRGRCCELSCFPWRVCCWAFATS